MLITLEGIDGSGKSTLHEALKEKLADLAAAIGKVGFGVAVACFLALIIKWCAAARAASNPWASPCQPSSTRFLLCARHLLPSSAPSQV